MSWQRFFGPRLASVHRPRRANSGRPSTSSLDVGAGTPRSLSPVWRIAALASAWRSAAKRDDGFIVTAPRRPALSRSISCPTHWHGDHLAAGELAARIRSHSSTRTKFSAALSRFLQKTSPRSSQSRAHRRNTGRRFPSRAGSGVVTPWGADQGPVPGAGGGSLLSGFKPGDNNAEDRCADLRDGRTARGLHRGILREQNARDVPDNRIARGVLLACTTEWITRI